MKSALIDTNLTVLMIVGLTNKNYIKTHKRTREFTVQDFDILLSVLDQYDVLWVTSHCFAEVSNLLKQTHETQAKELLLALSAFGKDVKESHICKAEIFDNESYCLLGIADSGFLQKSKRVNCSYTVDLDLYLSIGSLGRNVVNFNHLRLEHLCT